MRCATCDSIFDGRQHLTENQHKPTEKFSADLSIREFKRHLRNADGMPVWQYVLWGFTFVSFTLGFLFQIAWINRSELAEHPQYGAQFKQLCMQLAFCVLPEKRDVGAFSLASRQIFSHPNVQNALLLSASFTNDADYAQRYPTILVSMSNKQGAVMAERYFEPHEYSNKLSTDALIETNQTIDLSLTLSDPGDAAIAFEIDFY